MNFKDDILKQYKRDFELYQLEENEKEFDAKVKKAMMNDKKYMKDDDIDLTDEQKAAVDAFCVTACSQ